MENPERNNRDTAEVEVRHARVKFRENYQLKSNEIWFEGMPVEMRFDIAGPSSVPWVTTGKVCWVESVPLERWATKIDAWLDEAERLAAFDRMRAYYYETHPGKALDGVNRVVWFEMDGDIGRAYCSRYGEKSSWGNSGHLPDNYYNSDVKRVLTKLRKWTEEQLAKRPKKFAFMCHPTDFLCGPYYTLKFYGNGDVGEVIDKAMKESGTWRVTIEPIDKESRKP